jgi:integration host factor subunit beta
MPPTSKEAMASLSQSPRVRTPAPPAWAPCCAPSWTTTRSKFVEQTTRGSAVPPAPVLYPQLANFHDPIDLVEELAARFSQLTHRDAEFAVKAILDAMSDALVRGHRIEIRGFGSFSINRRPPRMGRNPRSGESVHIPEKRVPHFKPGKALREAVDQRTAELRSDGKPGS